MLDINILNEIREARKQGYTLEEILIAVAITNGVTLSDGVTSRLDLTSQGATSPPFHH